MEVGKWSEGRPVFKKVHGEPRVLLVREGIGNWAIIESDESDTGLDIAHIQSGRGTNSPSSPQAGASDRFGWSRWMYWDNQNNWVEGDISVTCK